MSRNNFSLARASLTNPALYTLVNEIRFALRGCATILDVGCGDSSPLRFLRGEHLTGVDGYGPSLEEAKRRGTHDEYVLGDVTKLTQIFTGKRFDACVALDVIEHLPKEHGWRLLEMMEGLAKKRVVIFTPNGFVPQKSKHGDLQEHLSGWTAVEMRDKGYQVIGIGGPKSLRGEYHALKYKPRVFWAVVSLLAHYGFSRNRAEAAAAIFCVKGLSS